jgi:hypothetical protein
MFWLVQQIWKQRKMFFIIKIFQKNLTWKIALLNFHPSTLLFRPLCSHENFHLLFSQHSPTDSRSSLSISTTLPVTLIVTPSSSHFELAPSLLQNCANNHALYHWLSHRILQPPFRGPEMQEYPPTGSHLFVKCSIRKGYRHSFLRRRFGNLKK